MPLAEISHQILYIYFATQIQQDIKKTITLVTIVKDATMVSAESFTIEFNPSKSIPAPTQRVNFNSNPPAFFLNEKVFFFKCFHTRKTNLLKWLILPTSTLVLISNTPFT